MVKVNIAEDASMRPIMLTIVLDSEKDVHGLMDLLSYEESEFSQRFVAALENNPDWDLVRNVRW